MKHRLVLHIGFWLSYLLLSSYITADLGNSSYKEYSWMYRLGIATSEKIGIVAIQAAIFYWLFYYCLPRLKNINVVYIIQIIFGVVISVILYRMWVGYIVYPMVYGETYKGNLFSLPLMIFSFINIYSFVGIAGAIKLIKNRQLQKAFQQQLIKEKLQSELHFLRAQINPHFFFNTLNNIYGLARRQSKDTAEVVMRLSKLMRFILYECTSESIPISQEIKVLEDYVELEKIRYNERLKIDFEKEIDDDNQQIAPLLLLPFVENSFKHGASKMRFETEIKLRITLKNKHLIFSIFNTKDSIIEENEKGLGLQNVKRQLELLYPDTHEVIINETKNSFDVQLKIELK
jgi:two-component system LytT family sensor kinase